jgi:hypothetical protein
VEALQKGRERELKPFGGRSPPALERLCKKTAEQVDSEAGYYVAVGR